MTIKLQGGKVITKDGKVSCECCACCMYPAQALADGLYSEEDLPDAIQITVNAGIAEDGTYVLTKNTPPTSMPNGGLCYYGNFSNNNITDDDIIYLVVDNEVGALWFFRIKEAEIDNLCLVISEEQSPSFYAEDQFADTYTISGPISGALTRESVCVWRGPNLRLTNFGYQWRVNGNNKSGFQNTPVGSYAGGFSVS